MDAQRLAEIEEDLRQPSLFGSVAVLVAAVAFLPWAGWLVVPAAVPLLCWLVCHLWAKGRVPVTVWSPVNAGVQLVVVGIAIAASGGPTSPLLFFLPVLGILLAARLPGQLAISAGLPVLLLLIATVGIDASATRADPLPAVACLLASVLVPLFATQLVDVEVRYRQRSIIDPLTGSLNRHALERRVDELTAQGAVTGATVGVVVVDIDGFKQLNDRHGHSHGDRVLTDLAYAWRKALPSFDLLYRTGGDEFTVIVPGADDHTAPVVAESLRVAAAGLDPGGHLVTVSCGVAVGGAADPGIALLTERADRALYRAKAAGRNRVASADVAVSAVDGTGPLAVTASAAG